MWFVLLCREAEFLSNSSASYEAVSEHGMPASSPL
jgi:hypothetical protein